MGVLMSVDLGGVSLAGRKSQFNGRAQKWLAPASTPLLSLEVGRGFPSRV